MSEKVREDILNSIPLANGMIQAGERIVDRGEIIDNHTYNVLRSLKIVHETKSGGAQRQGIIMGWYSVFSSASGCTCGLSG